MIISNINIININNNLKIIFKNIFTFILVGTIKQKIALMIKFNLKMWKNNIQ